jgi:hypothetical protein
VLDPSIVQQFDESGSCDEELDLGQGRLPLFGNTKSIDFGVVFGFGADFSAWGGAISTQIRFDLGLSDISEDPEFVIKNRALGFMVAYLHYFGS